MNKVLRETVGESLFKEMLESEYLDFKGGKFRQNDVEALEKVAQMALKPRMMVVEVGSWKGRATAVLTKVASGYQGSVFAVDHWLGSEGVQDERLLAQSADIFSIFKRNMIFLGLWDTVHPLVMDSQTASQIFADGILDLVFIDADHRYEYLKKDISSWLPKLKDGGILSGHDCEGYYSEYSEEIKRVIDKHLDDDYILSIHCHPGVIKGLHECFSGKYSIMPNSKVWYCIKGVTVSK